MMALSVMARAFRSLNLSTAPKIFLGVQGSPLFASQGVQMTPQPCRFLAFSYQSVLGCNRNSPCICAPQPECGLFTSAALSNNNPRWKQRKKYTIRPIGMKKTGGRDHTGKIRVHGIGGGHKQRYRIIDFQRLHYEPGKQDNPFEERVIEVRYDPCRSADIALVAGGIRKRWIIATENMEAGDIIKTSGYIGRMAGTCGVLLRKVNGTAIVQLPSKRQVQVLEMCMATVGRVSNIDHNKRIIGKAGRNRWLGIRPSSGLWQRKGGWAGRKIKPIPPMKNYVNLPSAFATS
ncbi:39S ribosomal protein L2, mitochondrial isoform X2 [Latimeria chalumnae]|uniref:39S ribosomal protein L2, mitochondrial isoform X2 n=1 Tax=Latimeria chalumnae TaxID=7897 RepID=UPI00313E6EA9